MLEYIERNKVLAEEEFFGEHDTWDNPMADGCMAVRSDFIMNIPAADVQPVIRGKWILDGCYHKCSECYDYAPFTKSGEERLSDFCPFCGANMREDDKVS